MKKFILALVPAFGLVVTAVPALAHFLWMEPIGQQETINPGDTVSVNFYLHAEIDDELHGWSVSMGFDDTAMDGGELTYDSIEFGPGNLTNFPAPHEYVQGNSLKHPGESWVKNISRWDVLGLVPPPEYLTAGEDFLLFTGHFIFNGGIWDGLEDVWFEDNGGIDGWDFNSGQFHWLEVYTDNTGTTLLGDGGPDYNDGCDKYVFHPGFVSCPTSYTPLEDVFPEELAEEIHYSGAAAAMQTIRWMWGEIPLVNPCDHLGDFYRNYAGTQTELYDYYGSGDSTDFTESQMRSCIQAEKPTEKWYGEGPVSPSYAYNFTAKSISDEDDAIKTFIHWFDFNINQYYAAGTVNNPNVPSLIATDNGSGGYRWMTLRGFVTDADPCDESSVWTIPELVVYGLWLNDPSIGGLGANAYVTGEDFKANEFEPIGGYYRGVTEPPTDLDEGLFNQSLRASRINYIGGKPDMKVFMAMAAKGDAELRAAEFEKVNWEDVIPSELLNSPDFEAIYSGCRFNGTLKVDDLKTGDSYQLVTFSQGLQFHPVEKKICRLVKKRIDRSYATASIVLLVNEATGEFRQATWVAEDEKYMPLTEAEAVAIAGKAASKEIKIIDDRRLAIGIMDERGDFNIRLVFDNECGSRFLPVYEVTMQNGAMVYVFQDGTYVIKKKPVPVSLSKIYLK